MATSNPQKGGVIYNIINYGQQGIQIGDCNTMQISELLSEQADVKKGGLEKDGILKGALSFILNPRRTQVLNPMTLKMLEEKFTETFGNHPLEGKKTFTGVSGISLLSFLQHHTDTYETFTTPKGKVMVKQKIIRPETYCMQGHSSEPQTNASDGQSRGMRCSNKQGRKVTETNERKTKSPIERTRQDDNDSDEWTVVCRGKNKKTKTVKEQNTEAEERTNIRTQKSKNENEGTTYIRTLLKRRNRHDFKCLPSELVYVGNYLLFTIDIVSMWNTPKEASSFILLGAVDSGTDNLPSITGIKKSYTPAHFKGFFLTDCIVGSAPDYSYSEVTVGSDLVGVIEIFRCQGNTSPSVFKCNRANSTIATCEGDMWIRRDNLPVVCKPTDDRFAEVYSWFAKGCGEDNRQGPNSEAKPCPRQGDENNGEIYVPQSILKTKRNEATVCTTVNQMLDAVNHFRKGHFILLAGDVPSVSTNIGAVASVPWLTVFDFDPYSRDRGLLDSNEELMSKSTSLHITTWKTIDKPVSEYGTNWCFICGSRDDPESRPCTEITEDVRSWSRKIKQFVNPYLGDIQDFIADNTVLTSIVLWPNDERMVPYILKMVNKLDENIDPPPKLVIVLESEPKTEEGKTCFRTLCQEQNENLTLVKMTVTDVLEGVNKTLRQRNDTNKKTFDLPAVEQRDACIPERDALWLREHLNVLFKLCPFEQDENDLEFLQEESDNFYRGGTLHWRTWYTCEVGHFDIERDIHKKTKAAIEMKIHKNKSCMVTLCHAPGAGGTTLAQRLAWEFHEKLPTVHVRNSIFNIVDVVTRIEYIYTKTRRPVLLFIDGEDDQKVFHLLQYLKSSYCCAIIFHVKRCLSKPDINTDDANSMWLGGNVSPKEAKQLTLKLTGHCKDDSGKKRALHNLCEETAQGNRHHLINFGLTVFLHEFKGISSFVKGYLPVSEHDVSTTADQSILLYLALAYYYGHASIPCQFFAELLHLPPNYCVDIDDFPLSVQSFIVEDVTEGRKSNIRICHNLVAKEILDHLLSRGKTSKDRAQIGLSDTARHRLASLCLEFISYASRRERRGYSLSNVIVNCLRRIFIVRDPMDMCHGSENLNRKSPISNVLKDINSAPPMFCERLEVLKKLVEVFPKDPNFLAHLGRFYANCLPQQEKEAERCFIMSLELCEGPTKGMSDGKLNDRFKLPLMYIYHMYGMFLLKRIKRMTGMGILDDGHQSSSKTANSSCNINDLLSFVHQACSLFEKSRMYTPVGHESGYGYTGEIEVRLHFCDFLQKEENDAFLHNTAIREKTDAFVRKSIPIIDQLIHECTKESVHQKEISYFLSKYSRWYDLLFKGKDVALERLDDCQDIDSCRLGIAMAKLNSKSGFRSSFNIIDNIKEKEQIHVIVNLYERIFEMVNVCDSYREKKALETNLVDWLRAIRHKEMTTEYGLEHVLVQVAKLNNLISSPIPKFYMFILKSLIGFGICSASRQVDTSSLYDAKQLKLDLKTYGKYVMKSKQPWEWVGISQNGIKRLLPGSQCSSLLSENRATRHFPLLHIFKGTICHPNKKKLIGFINLDLGENTYPVEAFFIPDVANMSGPQNAGRRVEFTLAFTFENGYEAFYVTSLKKYKCTNFPCGASVEITSAEEFGVCCACRKTVSRNDLYEEDI